MARPLRLEFPGAIYHLTGRGNARQKVFFTDADRELFLSTLTGVVTRYHWICRAYCLMANHYHLLVETPKANLSIGMRQINGIYTQSFNRRHKRVGHLFQGRFKAILVERDSDPVISQNWIEWINEPDKASKLDDLRSCAQRGRPFGSEDWMINIAKKLGLEATMHSHGRPKRK